MELLRQNENNRLAVENVAIAIAVLSENDAVACDALGNFHALDALLQCIRKYDDNVVVTKRLMAALRALVGGSRRNTKLLQAHESLARIAAAGSSSRFEEEPSVADDSLRIVATALVDGPMSLEVGDNSRDYGSGLQLSSLGSPERRGSLRSLSNFGIKGYGKQHPICSVFSLVLQAMELHEQRSEVQISGMLALRALLAQPDRRELPAVVLLEMVGTVGTAFRLHAANVSEIGWLTLGLHCDVDIARESHLRVQLDLECFFASLRHVVAATEVETGALEEAGAKLVSRALHMTSHIGWRNKETQQNAVDAGAVDACLDVLRVFQGQPEVLEAVCGLIHGLLDSAEASTLVEAKSQAFVDGILCAICEMTRS